MRFPRCWLVLIALLIIVSSAYLTISWTTAKGRPVAPLDDAYITFQYARQIAEGQPYRYNSGDPPTTGMTSPLFGFLLAGAYLLGFTGESLPALAIGLGVAWLGLISWLTYRISYNLTESKKWSCLAAGLVILTGSVQWGCFNGMETGFFTVLTLAAIDAFVRKQYSLSALWLSLAGLGRPEGLILAVLTWTVSLADGLFSADSFNSRRQTLLSIALIVSLTPQLVNLNLTGNTASTGLLAKSWWYNIPYYPGNIIRSILSSYWMILASFAGWPSSGVQFLPPGLLFLSLLGCIWLAIRSRWTSLTLVFFWFLLGTLSSATLITAPWHLGRYQVPFVPVITIAATAGIAWINNQANKQWQYHSLILMIAALSVLSVKSLPDYIRSYRDAIETIARQHMQTVDWLNANLPHDAYVGITDAGVLRYMGDHPTYDLIGLTTPDAATAWRHGAGSVFELMERSQRRPTHFALFPDISVIPYFKATDLLEQSLFKVEIAEPGISSPSRIMGVWRADWQLAGSGEIFYQPDILKRTAGLEVVDTMDVADLDDETAHAVEWWQDVQRSGFPTEFWQLHYRVPSQTEVLDGGRLLTGGIALDVNTRVGEPLWIVARLHAQQAGAVQVEVDGREVGRWIYPPVSGQWLETLFQVPASEVTNPQTRVKLSIDADNPDFQHYAPYYYWFLQGEAEEALPPIGYSIEAHFAGDLSLVSFDLPKQVWHPGDTIPITLYWRAMQSTQSNAKVFLHLYGPDGRLGPQSDGWAFHDTRPPYTWTEDETVTDPRELALPQNLPPGEYSLEAGLYNPAGADRLPAYSDGVRLPEDRVVLTIIRVVE
jgi:hypothetical protein